MIKLLQDPRQIRRYFKMSAIMTLIADFSSAGYKAAFEEEFRNDLAARGLLVPVMRRESFARYYLLAAVAGVIAVSVCVAIFIHPWYFAAAMIVMCMLSATALRFALLLLHSIPLYSEIGEVIAHLKRQSWRLELLRIVIRFLTVMSYLVVFVGFLVLTGVALAIITIGFHNSHLTFLAVYCVLTVGFMVPVQLALDAWRLRLEERASAEGEKRLALIRHQLAVLSPLDSFKEVLQTTEYVPTFSELLALYGIETLLILA